MYITMHGSKNVKSLVNLQEE